LSALLAKLQEAYAGISRQNETVTNLFVQRDELAQKFKGLMQDRNNVAEQYNELAERLLKLQDNAPESEHAPHGCQMVRFPATGSLDVKMAVK